jgi:hypothetical protein
VQFVNASGNTAARIAARVRAASRRIARTPPPHRRISIFNFPFSHFVPPPMSRCIALVPTRASAPAWNRCLRRARPGDRFCAHHRHALDGAVMGLLHSKEYRHAQQKSPAQLARQARKEARTKKRREAREKKSILARYGRKNPAHALAAFFGE